MTTVLSVGNSEGENRCDARCHDARTAPCDCVCRGRYHGRGSARVLDQVQKDVVGGVFGEAVAIEGRRQLERIRQEDPLVLRYHRREVARAVQRRQQMQIDNEERPRPARVAGGRPHG